jgi:hypothetical protein
VTGEGQGTAKRALYDSRPASPGCSYLMRRVPVSSLRCARCPLSTTCRLAASVMAVSAAMLLALPQSGRAMAPPDRSPPADDHWSFRAPGSAPSQGPASSRRPVMPGTGTDDNWGFHSAIPGAEPRTSGRSPAAGKLPSTASSSGGFQSPRPIAGGGATSRAGCSSPGGG